MVSLLRCPLPLLGRRAHAKPPEVFEQLLLYICLYTPRVLVFFLSPLSLPEKLVLLPTLRKRDAKSRTGDYLLARQ